MTESKPTNGGLSALAAGTALYLAALGGCAPSVQNPRPLRYGDFVHNMGAVAKIGYTGYTTYSLKEPEDAKEAQVAALILERMQKNHPHILEDIDDNTNQVISPNERMKFYQVGSYQRYKSSYNPAINIRRMGVESLDGGKMFNVYILSDTTTGETKYITITPAAESIVEGLILRVKEASKNSITLPPLEEILMRHGDNEFTNNDAELFAEDANAVANSWGLKI